MASEIKDILFLLPMQDKHRKLLENAAPGAIVRMVRRRELQDSEISNAQVIIGNLAAIAAIPVVGIFWFLVGPAIRDALDEVKENKGIEK